jgi:hypothetical protein
MAGFEVTPEASSSRMSFLEFERLPDQRLARQ